MKKLSGVTLKWNDTGTMVLLPPEMVEKIQEAMNKPSAMIDYMNLRQDMLDGLTNPRILGSCVREELISQTDWKQIFMDQKHEEERNMLK